MSKLNDWTKDNINYILIHKQTLTAELLEVILETHRQMSVLDHLIKESEKTKKWWEKDTAHGHGGNDTIPQPDPSAGMLSPMTRVVNDTIEQVSNETDHPNTI
jgi:hypothetical protein